jgi:hypothetical protein
LTSLEAERSVGDVKRERPTDDEDPKRRGISLHALRAFATREFGRVTALKQQYWLDRKRRLGPAEGVRVADALRRQVAAQRPGWPSPEERQADLASHARVGELLRRAGTLGSN